MDEKFERIYRGVPMEQVEQILQFRSKHPAKHILVNGLTWEYIATEPREDTLVILPGGLRKEETAFKLIQSLEDDFQVIAPSYPPAPKVDLCLEGVRAILRVEGVQQANIFGTSAGGMLAQCFVRKYPEQVKRLAIGDTSLPDRVMGENYLRRGRILPLMPAWLIQWAGRRSLPKLVEELPLNIRAFWLAYLREAIPAIYSREWLIASHQLGIDYFLNRTFTKDDLKDWHGKMLIVESDNDTVIGFERLKAVREMYPQAPVYVFHDAGHVPAISHEVEFVQLLRKFVNKVEADWDLMGAAVGE